MLHDLSGNVTLGWLTEFVSKGKKKKKEVNVMCHANNRISGLELIFIVKLCKIGRYFQSLTVIDPSADNSIIGLMYLEPRFLLANAAKIMDCFVTILKNPSTQLVLTMYDGGFSIERL
ncbi:hypothetical protein CEXT_123261 [Caerostris extrusa]|uniref:Uncharacterized protein n=1 Tax=Caerostris extrusa TaxID=172846 RepID=A0AAV4XUH4_CAEEX|nr:hypothetical protein CEXT_123261 [Caerostris extrusa]